MVRHVQVRLVADEFMALRRPAEPADGGNAASAAWMMI
jgi:hypothetical protein